MEREGMKARRAEWAERRAVCFVVSLFCSFWRESEVF